MILIYTICKNPAEAKKIAGVLLKLKLIACANWWSVTSTYVWKSKVVLNKETAMFLKTRKENYKKVEAIIKKMHSYSVPCILELDVDQRNPAYRDWVRKETRII
ncbi:MAG: divalent-cation tolerance protein CutA [Patescibacteria group bacterium]|jgi:periplasmic divalent cation tolerance protein